MLAETSANSAAQRYIQVMDRMVTIYASHEQSAAADRAELRRLSPQARLDRALRLHQAYRERLGDAGCGLVRVAQITDRAPR